MSRFTERDEQYKVRLADFIQNEYGISALSITPAERGYYGETWRVDAADSSYFLKLDYLKRHQVKYQNSLHVVQYLCDCGINFISKIVKTTQGELYSHFDSAVLGIFEWIDGENIETDDTKIPEYKMLAKIYPLTKQGFDIPTINFNAEMADVFFENWNILEAETSNNESTIEIIKILEQSRVMLSHRAKRLAHFAALCQADQSHFYITHGDAGGNLIVDGEQCHIIDWDEVMYAPLERDAWVMCCRDWSRELFADTIRRSGVNYSLRPERLAFYCYHMFFLFLNEYLEDFMLHGNPKEIEEYFNGWIEERVRYADSIT